MRWRSLVLTSCAAAAVLLLALHCFFAQPAFAERMKVAARGMYDVRTIDIGPGQYGRIQVHLKSAGELVGGYEVSLYRDSDAERLATRVSDEHGIVTFEGLRPDSYTVILLRSAKMKAETTLAIGDFLLEAYYPGSGMNQQIPEEVSDSR